jgi:anterior pharynx defective protein 1
MCSRRVRAYVRVCSYWKLLKKAEKGLNILGDDGKGAMSQSKLAMVAGLGFGTMSTVMQINQILEEAAGPGSLPAPGCTQHSIYLIASITIACFGALNVLWSVIMHHGLDSGNRVNMWIPPATHFMASMLTLNNADGGPCTGTLVPLFMILVGLSGYTWKLLGLHVKA